MQPKMKVIGRKVFPNSADTFPNKRSAAIVDDAIELHGARINVAVPADRIVRLEEDDIECWIDTHLAKLTVRKHRRGERPPYGAFLFELPKRVLKRFPIAVEYDSRGDLVGITIFRSSPRQRKRPRPARQGKKRAARRERSV